MPCATDTPTRDAGPIAVSSPTAEALLRIGVQGDGQAWTFLVETHGARIHRLAWRILGSASAADDGVQQVFLRLPRAAKTFQAHAEGTEGRAVAWLLRFATTTLLQAARSEQRRRRREVGLSPALPRPSAEDAGEDPRLPQLRAALARLPERHRRVVHLRYHAELAPEELAVALGCPPTTARVRVHRALQALRTQLARAQVVLAGTTLPAVLQVGTPPAATVLERLPTPPRIVPPWRRSLAAAAPSVLAAAVAAALVLHLGSARPPAPAPRAEAPPIPPAPPAAAPLVPATDWARLQLNVDWKEMSLPEVQEFFHRVLRVPLSIDPDVQALGLPPFSMHLRWMRLGDALFWAARLQGLQVRALPTGGWALSSTASASAKGLRTPHLIITSLPALTLDGDPEPGLRALLRTLPGAQTVEVGRWQVADHRPVHVRLPPVSSQGEEVLRALAGGAIGELLPQDRLAHQRWLGGWGTLPLPEVAARIAAVSGLPCRVDADSGPWPVLARRGSDAPVRVGDLLEVIAQVARATCCQAADGMVIFRNASQRYADAQEELEDAQNRPYRDTRPPWWSFAAAMDRSHPLPVVMPLERRLITVAWRDAPLAQVLQDLQARLGVPVVMPKLLQGEPVTLVLPERTTAEVLILLEAATGLRWTLQDDVVQVGMPPVPTTASGPGSTPSAPGPARAPALVPAPAPSPPQPSERQ